jgi:hypothetical protein
MLFWRDGQVEEAADLLTVARRIAPSSLPLAIEFGKCLIEAGRSHQWLKHLPSLPDSIRMNGRIRLLEAQAALAENEFEIVERFFDEQIVVEDLREGESILSDLWIALHRKRLSAEEKMLRNDSLSARIDEPPPVPAFFDFRMS